MAVSSSGLAPGVPPASPSGSSLAGAIGPRRRGRRTRIGRCTTGRGTSTLRYRPGGGFRIRGLRLRRLVHVAIIHYLEDRRLALTEVARVLRPGGRFFFV